MTYSEIKEYCDDTNVTLVAVSKRQSHQKILELYNQGHRDFGENRVQELCEKQKALPKDIRWHQIGQLQRKKVKQIAPFVEMIQSVDSLDLLKEIQKRAFANDRKIEILIQINISLEESKSGFKIEEFKKLNKSEWHSEFRNIVFRGLMAIGTNSRNLSVRRSEFVEMNDLLQSLKSKNWTSTFFDTLSMGMSSDYPLAVECGSNMIRVGSLLFGERL